MPYGNGDLSMVVLLPKKIDGLADLEKDLNADKLAGWLDKAREQEMPVALPKFTMTSEFSLKDALEALGMKTAFRSPGADFSGLNGRKDDLYLKAVVHKAFVDVNEEGTEAAAATGAVVATRGARLEFRADHPFRFALRDSTSGTVLMTGIVRQP